jgi:hypothetical protein
MGRAFGRERARNQEAILAVAGRAGRPHMGEHDPEKWEPVFGKDHAQTKG